MSQEDKALVFQPSTVHSACHGGWVPWVPPSGQTKSDLLSLSAPMSINLLLLPPLQSRCPC